MSSIYQQVEMLSMMLTLLIQTVIFGSGTVLDGMMPDRSWGPQGLQELQAPLEPQASRALPELRVLPELQAPLEPPGHKEQLEMLDQRALQALQEQPELSAQQDLKVLQVSQEPQE